MKRLIVLMFVLMNCNQVLAAATDPCAKTERRPGLKQLGRLYQNSDYPEAFALATTLAEKGCNPARVFLGRLYSTNQGVIQSAVKAVKWYRLAAEGNNVHGMQYLALAYGSGVGIKQDDEQAAIWFERAARRGSAPSMDLLGDAYFLGRGVDKNPEQAVYWYRNAAEQGYALGQYSLGVAYYRGVGVEKDDEQALHWICQSASQSHAPAVDVLDSAWNGLPSCSDSATSTTSDKTAVVSSTSSKTSTASVSNRLKPFFDCLDSLKYGDDLDSCDHLKSDGSTDSTSPSKARDKTAVVASTSSESGRTSTPALSQAQIRAWNNCMNALKNKKPIEGCASVDGSTPPRQRAVREVVARTTTKDTQPAVVDPIPSDVDVFSTRLSVAQLMTLADQGNSDAAYILAHKFYHGHDVAKNEALAVEYATLTANAGNSWGLNILSGFHKRGIGGLRKSTKKAIELQQAAAARGNGLALTNLGLAYINGDGVEENKLFGLTLLSRAAQMQEPLGQYLLGKCRYNGTCGLRKDVDEGGQWLRLAAAAPPRWPGASTTIQENAQKILDGKGKGSSRKGWRTVGKVLQTFAAYAQQDNARIDRENAARGFPTNYSGSYGGVSRPNRTPTARASGGMGKQSLPREYTEAFTKICFYDTIKGKVAINISSTSICPISLPQASAQPAPLPVSTSLFRDDRGALSLFD